MMSLNKSLIIFVLLLLSSWVTLTFRYSFYFYTTRLLASRLTLFKWSPVLWMWSCNYCILAFLLWSKNVNIFVQNVAYDVSVRIVSLAEVLILYLMFSQTLFLFSLLRSCKPVWYLNLILFPNLQLIELPEIKSFHSNFCAASVLTANLSVTYQSKLPWKFVPRVYSNIISYLSISDQSGCESAHQERSRCTEECFSAGISCS